MEQTATFVCYNVSPIELKRVKRIEADLAWTNFGFVGETQKPNGQIL